MNCHIITLVRGVGRGVTVASPGQTELSRSDPFVREFAAWNAAPVSTNARVRIVSSRPAGDVGKLKENAVVGGEGGLSTVREGKKTGGEFEPPTGKCHISWRSCTSAHSSFTLVSVKVRKRIIFMI